MKPFVVLEPFMRRVPAAWRCRSLRRVSSVVEDVNAEADELLLSLTIAGKLTPRGDDVQPPSEAYLRNYGIVRPGDLVVNPMWLSGGSIGVSSARGAVSPEYRIFRFGRDVEPRFVHHLVRSDPYMHQYRLLVRAETTFDRRVTKDDFRDLPLLLPPIATQRAIADYLDTETARIDALITKKRRLIELLDERCRVAVDALMGVVVAEGRRERRGEGWVPLRYVAEVRGGFTLGKTFDEPTVVVPYLRVLNVQDGSVDLADVAEIALPQRMISRYLLREGDVLLLEGNGNPENLGRGTMWRSEIEPCVHQNHVHVVRADQTRILPEYLDLVTRSSMARAHFAVSSDVVGISTLSQERIRSLRVPLPSLSKQAELVSGVTASRLRRDAAQLRLRRQTNLLVEHRQALITAAVTGEVLIS